MHHRSTGSSIPLHAPVYTGACPHLSVTNSHNITNQAIKLSKMRHAFTSARDQPLEMQSFQTT
eukprot:1476151-Amphidinium_carterae.1